MYNLVHVIFPVILLVVRDCPEHIQQRSIKSFHLPVTLWVVGCSAGMLYARKLFKPPEELTLKFSTLVVMDFGGKPETKYEIVVQLVCHVLSSFVSSRVGLCISRKVINDH